MGKYYFPSFECPEQKRPIDYLRELCIKGLKERYEDEPERFDGQDLSEEVMARLDRELEVIEKLGYPTYFLIVWDFVACAARGFQQLPVAVVSRNRLLYALHVPRVSVALRLAVRAFS